jgi:hypothetical protein
MRAGMSRSSCFSVAASPYVPRNAASLPHVSHPVPECERSSRRGRSTFDNRASRKQSGAISLSGPDPSGAVHTNNSDTETGSGEHEVSRVQLSQPDSRGNRQGPADHRAGADFRGRRVRSDPRTIDPPALLLREGQSDAERQRTLPAIYPAMLPPHLRKPLAGGHLLPWNWRPPTSTAAA